MSIAGPGLRPTLFAALLLIAGAGCTDRPLPDASADAGGAGGAPLGRGGAGGGAGAGGDAGAAGAVGAAGVSGVGRGGSGGGPVDCAVAPAGTVCREGACVDGNLSGQYACNATGTCAPQPTIVCAPYRCDLHANACASSCTADTDCTNDRPCRDGYCVLPTEHCSSDGECPSGYCVDGVCCDGACTGACVACNIPGREGTCSPVPAGAADPRAFCLDAGAATCGRDGTCDGVGGCANYPFGTTCGVADCQDGVYSPAPKCNGVGTCVRTTMSCAPFSCDPQKAECRSTCSTDGDCAAPTVCVSGSCVLSGAALCSSSVECSSGVCAKGRCGS
jgi:hypothetical protein